MVPQTRRVLTTWMLWTNLFLTQKRIKIKKKKLCFPLVRNIDPTFTVLPFAIYSSLVVTENENTQLERRPSNVKGKASQQSQTTLLSDVLVLS